ncbi:hypothetical protein IMCC3317_24470 [Kordia antarctica]|uniref:Uncharacterized protein n=1 Tax=Kordia antarctica TaxID=1218801 RepID=A0A7L4ZKX4_9FLAO|nr:hypothetical protein [Kordia antarctica]QHI37069.1 hypothetical protein IMCC3317_24470 [Kordia antarctica]
MKKRNFKTLSLNKRSISNLKFTVIGGRANKTADVKDCPDNTLAKDCESLGACPDSFWCQASPVGSDEPVA